jgi:5-methylcytosine-specific restriction endonuclease McrA
MPTPSRKTLRMAASLRAIDLAATARGAARLPDQELANAERVRLYHTARWQRARLRFLQDHPLCAECERHGLVVAAVAVDHRDGHRHTRWREKFWDEEKWQGMCTDCHAVKSAKEQAEYRMGASQDAEG